MFGFGEKNAIEEEENNDQRVSKKDVLDLIAVLKTCCDFVAEYEKDEHCGDSCDNSCSNGSPAYFCVIGSYPNIQIVDKWYVAEDEFNYCLRNKESNTLDLHKKDTVFTTYEAANNRVLELIQKQQCACATKKGK